MDDVLLKLILVFAPLSLMSLGGGQAIIAEIQHQSVDIQHWFSPGEFADLFAISRAAPGPNTLIASLIGWQLKGVSGALVATLAIYIPSSVLFVVVTSLWHKYKDSPWRRAIERGLAPIALGLIFAGVLSILESIHITLIGIFTMLVSLGVLYFTKTNPYYLIFGVGLFYTGVFFVS